MRLQFQLVEAVVQFAVAVAADSAAVVELVVAVESEVDCSEVADSFELA